MRLYFIYYRTINATQAIECDLLHRYLAIFMVNIVPDDDLAIPGAGASSGMKLT